MAAPDVTGWDGVLTMVENHGLAVTITLYFLFRMDNLMGQVRDVLLRVANALDRLHQ